MSIIDIKPSDMPIELKVKIEHIMSERNLSWREAIISLALKVIPPFDDTSRSLLSLLS